MKRTAWIAVLLLGGVALLVWLRPAEPPKADRLQVVASFYPLREFTRQVGGDRMEVTSLVPPGVEPHDWEPSPADMAQVQRARLFIYNGAGLEPWVAKLLREIAGKGLVAVKVTEGLPLKGTPPDPHVWLDPVLVQSQVEAIRAGLARADPAHAATYEANARAFTAKLAALHGEFEQGLAKCARRQIITSHAAFGYLAARYGLALISIAGLAPEAEPNPAELARLVQLVRRHGIRYVFFETLVSPRLAEALAREVGARTLVLNPIEGLTKEEAGTGRDYLALMRENLRSLREGLECQ